MFLFLAFMGNTPAQEYKLCKDPGKHFQVSIPATWTFVPKYKEALFLAYRPLDHKGETKVENVALSKIEDTSLRNIDQVYSLAIFTQKAKDSITLLAEHRKPGKGSYYWYESSHITKAKAQIRSLTFVYYIKRHAYILQCTASPSTYNTYKTIFLKIAASLQFY